MDLGSDRIFCVVLHWVARPPASEGKRGNEAAYRFGSGPDRSVICATIAGPVAAGTQDRRNWRYNRRAACACADFTAQTGIALAVLPMPGSSGANSAVADGKLGLAVSDATCATRRKRAACRSSACCALPTALRPSRPGPDGLATRRTSSVFYKSARALWPDGTPVLIVLRPRPDDSDNESWLALLSWDGRGRRAASQAARPLGRRH
jgi:hypothetical protein